MAIDLNTLWDLTDPAASEGRFVAALADATGDDAVILRTQIARTHGLRRDFERARRVLEAVGIQLALEAEGDGAGAPDPYVFEELEALYRALGDLPRAEHYAGRVAAVRAR